MTAKRISTLQFAVRPRVVGKFTGQLLLIFSVLLLVPIPVSLATGEQRFVLPNILIAACTGLTGFLLQRIRAPEDIQNNEALVISALIFIIAPLPVSFFFLQFGCGWLDAVFEAISGVTTTGLSNLAAVENLPGTFLFFRAGAPWGGGRGNRGLERGGHSSAE
jgi:trk system potassium uptake protein TrkH